MAEGAARAEEDLEKLVERVAAEAKLKPSEVREAIAAKQRELVGLVSQAGAAHIVANELGVRTLEPAQPAVAQIARLDEGMREADVVGRVVRVFGVRDFPRRDGTIGRVASVTLADGTGSIRVSFWDRAVEEIERHRLVEGTAVKLIGGLLKRDNRGGLEIRFTGRSRIVVEPKGVELPPLSELRAGAAGPARRVLLRDASPGSAVEVRATVTGLAEKDPFYEVCPTCAKRARADDKGVFLCPDHGRVKPSYALAVSASLDDGTGCIRAVFFRESAEALLGTTVAQARAAGERAGDMALPVAEAAPRAVGRELLVRGRVRRNEVSGQDELVVDSVASPDPVAEAAALAAELEGSTGTAPPGAS